jgi:hypothetical protein
MQSGMIHAIRHIGVHAAAALMALLVVACVAAGVGAAALIPAFACMVMMGAMVWMMAGGRGGSH